MPSPPELKTIIAETPGLWTRAELADYLHVGTDEISKIASRFGLVALEGHYPEHSVWRQILELEPMNDEAATQLRVQLQDINWVAKRIGRGASTIRNKIRAGTLQYPVGVQLGAVSPGGKEPRLRRWVAAEIEATRAGLEPPAFRRVSPLPVAPAGEVTSELPEAAQFDSVGNQMSASAPDPAADNIFARIVGANAR